MTRRIKRLARLDPYPDFSGVPDVPECVKFWSKVDKIVAYPCWIWLAKQQRGYGVFREGVRAARWAWSERNGPIPEGLEIDHTCFNPACVNPDHLEPVTKAVNRSRVRKITHCKNGHEFTPDNTYQAKGQRCCRACHREWSANYRNKYNNLLKIKHTKETYARY